MMELITDNLSGNHMGENHMMDWWGISNVGYWMLGLWLVFVVIAFLVYRDAENKGMNGLLWFILVALPWIGILFLVIYVVIREEEVPQEYPDVIKKSAEAILDERYAKGEITREEYHRMKQDIKGGENKWRI